MSEAWFHLFFLFFFPLLFSFIFFFLLHFIIQWVRYFSRHPRRIDDLKVFEKVNDDLKKYFLYHGKVEQSKNMSKVKYRIIISLDNFTSLFNESKLHPHILFSHDDEVWQSYRRKVIFIGTLRTRIIFANRFYNRSKDKFKFISVRVHLISD